MIGWIWRTLIGVFKPHQHDWEEESCLRFLSSDGQVFGVVISIERCRKCGKVK